MNSSLRRNARHDLRKRIGEYLGTVVKNDRTCTPLKRHPNKYVRLLNESYH